MCGICGTGDSPAGSALAETSAMAALLAHRGPGDRIVVSAGGGALATARLHVTAPRAPSGPYSAASGRVTAAVNGEIWNHAELRRELEARGIAVPDGADTAVVAPLYEAFGVPGLSRLSGMFAIAIHDARDGSTVLARDRFGVKPLYWQPGPPVRFASEASVLPGGGGLDADALDDYLALGFIPAPRTLDRAVRKVPAGTALVLRDGVVREVPLAAPPVAERGATATPDEVRETLAAAVRRHLMGDVPIGVYLSGGLDSATIAALVAASGAPLSTFALTFPGEGAYDEGAAARRTAAWLGARHVEVEMGARDLAELLPLAAARFGEPFGDPSALAVLRLSLAAARDVTVVLTGTGADELFSGYSRYRLGGVPSSVGGMARAAARVLPSSRRTRLGTAGALAGKLARAAHGDPAERYLAALEVVPAGWRTRLTGRASAPPVLARFRDAFARTASFADGARLADLGVYLPDDLLAKEDRMAMAASLENRVPFLDDAVADLAGRVAARRHTGVRGKRLLRRAMAPHLPSDVLRRKKHGFAVPVSEWLRGAARDVVASHLAPADARVRDVLDGAAVDALVAAHAAGDDALGAALHALLALEASLRLHRP
jgi:asparagine synthase (glutamine-hydrolysing)